MAGALLAAVAACSSPGALAPSTQSITTPATSATAPTRTASAAPTYALTQPTVWLCRPDMADNPCEGDLDTVVVSRDGSRSTRVFAADPDPAFDCFYVYPTVSRAPGRTAPLRSAPEIVRTARAQAALFQRECRLYAPVYRQITVAGLFSGGLADPEARATAQRDVVSAFHDYLNRDNRGRPFLLLGHSQGATSLVSLVQTEIDGDPVLRSRLVSAMLIGGGPFLAAGSETAGSFQNVPPCRSVTQTGCVVAYNTYDGVPPQGALFGRTTAGRRVICVNPAAPAGGRARLDPVVPVPSEPGADDVVGFAEFTDSVDAECRSTPDFSWLDVGLVPGSTLPDSAFARGLGPAWGLHRVDVGIALGDLVDLAASQAASLSG